ncbi:MAG: AAA family ATPase [Bdellovibrionota bacterium]
MAVNPNSHIIAITGGKGGVGKSVFGANLAFAFLMEMRAPTLLIDLDSQSCGDQNVILGMREPKTMNDLCNFSLNLKVNKMIVG